jgi:hypothetical protein
VIIPYQAFVTYLGHIDRQLGYAATRHIDLLDCSLLHVGLVSQSNQATA